MSDFDFTAPVSFKTSSPDWMFDGIPCECEMIMCPECDPDFFYDEMCEQEHIWDEVPF